MVVKVVVASTQSLDFYSVVAARFLQWLRDPGAMSESEWASDGLANGRPLPGQELRWFNHEENRLVEARLLEINRTRAVVQNSVDGKRWTIPFYLINLDGQAVDIAPGARRALDRNRLKVGDRVAFKDRQGQERFGQVLKLNPKSVAVQVGETRWRVAYSLLAPVIDGDLGTDDRALPGTWARIPASIEEAACDEEECAEEKPLPGSRG